VADENATKLRAWAAKTSPGAARDPATALRPGNKPGTFRHPFAVVDRTAYLQQIKGAGIFKRADDAPVEDVPLAHLRAVQRTVGADRLAQHVDYPGLIPKGERGEKHGGPVDLPVVVRTGGMDIIHDGTHRSTAAFLRGQPTVRARVVDLDKEGWKPPA